MKLNCWVTEDEHRHIHNEYNRARAGSRLKFAVYLKQKLLRTSPEKPPSQEAVALTILIQLQDREHQLADILDRLKRVSMDEPLSQLAEQIGEELQRIRQTLVDISAWLYES